MRKLFVHFERVPGGRWKVFQKENPAVSRPKYGALRGWQFATDGKAGAFKNIVNKNEVRCQCE